MTAPHSVSAWMIVMGVAWVLCPHFVSTAIDEPRPGCVREDLVTASASSSQQFSGSKQERLPSNAQRVPPTSTCAPDLLWFRDQLSIVRDLEQSGNSYLEYVISSLLCGRQSTMTDCLAAAASNCSSDSLAERVNGQIICKEQASEPTDEIQIATRESECRWTSEYGCLPRHMSVVSDLIRNCPLFEHVTVRDNAASTLELMHTETSKWLSGERSLPSLQNYVECLQHGNESQCEGDSLGCEWHSYDEPGHVSYCGLPSSITKAVIERDGCARLENQFVAAANAESAQRLCRGLSFEDCQGSAGCTWESGFCQRDLSLLFSPLGLLGQTLHQRVVECRMLNLAHAANGCTLGLESGNDKGNEGSSRGAATEDNRGQVMSTGTVQTSLIVSLSVLGGAVVTTLTVLMAFLPVPDETNGQEDSREVQEHSSPETPVRHLHREESSRKTSPPESPELDGAFRLRSRSREFVEICSFNSQSSRGREHTSRRTSFDSAGLGAVSTSPRLLASESAKPLQAAYQLMSQITQLVVESSNLSSSNSVAEDSEESFREEGMDVSVPILTLAGDGSETNASTPLQAATSSQSSRAELCPNSGSV